MFVLDSGLRWLQLKRSFSNGLTEKDAPDDAASLSKYKALLSVEVAQLEPCLRGEHMKIQNFFSIA